MNDRLTWPQICRSRQYQGMWVALDNCRYDQNSRQPIEGDVVDSDEDIAALCGRLRESQRGSCAILFCDSEVLIQGPARPGPTSERQPRTGT